MTVSEQIEHCKELQEEFRDTFHLFSEIDRLISETFQSKLLNISNRKASANDFERFVALSYEMSLREELAPVFRLGLFLSLYAYTEFLLDKICGLFYKQSGKTLDDLHGRGVQRTKEYLSTIALIKLPSFFDLELPLFNKLRNAFAHNGGIVWGKRARKLFGSRKNLQTRFKSDFDLWRKAVANFDMIEVGSGRYFIRLEDSYISNAKTLIEIMFNQLFCAVREKLGPCQGQDTRTPDNR